MFDALEGMVNGNKVRGRSRYQMIDNIMIRVEMFVQGTVRFTQHLDFYRKREGSCVT